MAGRAQSIRIQDAMYLLSGFDRSLSQGRLLVHLFLVLSMNINKQVEFGPEVANKCLAFCAQATLISLESAMLSLGFKIESKSCITQDCKIVLCDARSLVESMLNFAQSSIKVSDLLEHGLGTILP